jgi:hypothetical protein
LNDEGYYSEGRLPFFANKANKNGDAYFKPLLNNGPPVASPSPPEPAATALLTVESMMLLNITQLKDESKKRGGSCAGGKMTCRIV